MQFTDIFRRVSTHSRPKAAGYLFRFRCHTTVCFNTQPPEGGWLLLRVGLVLLSVSTHSRPKAAGPYIDTGIYD